MAAVIKTTTPEATTGSVLDRMGIAVSVFCLIQCLALPLLVFVSPVMSLGLLGHETFHLILLAVIVPIGAGAFVLGYSIHRNSTMLIPGLTGLLLVAFAAIFGHDLMGSLGSALVTSLGGLLLITGHWLNLRCRRRFMLGSSTSGV